jgi:hypothetical protein
MSESSRRKVVDARDARTCLLALAKSGESLRQWSRSNGVDGRSLRAWQARLVRQRAAAEEPMQTSVVELVPVPRGATGTHSARYVVRAADGTVEVGDDFDPATLRRIIEVLRTC